MLWTEGVREEVERWRGAGPYAEKTEGEVMIDAEKW